MVSQHHHHHHRLVRFSKLWAGLVALAFVALLCTIGLARHVHNTDERSLRAFYPPPSSDPTIPSSPTPNNGTIVVQLSGEMGNNLHKLAFAKGLQLMAHETLGLEFNLVLRHQDHPKWIDAKRNLQQCFPNLRALSFSAGNRKEFAERQIEQRLWLGDSSKRLEIIGKNDQVSMTRVLEDLHNILQQTSNPPPLLGDDAIIQLPFIYADTMVDWHILDRYRPQLLEWLAFDYQACCPTKQDYLPPAPDETVFHFRNFVTELQGATSALGFDELSPRQTATELLGHLKPGDKVAITTRFDNAVTQQYVDALQDRGLQVRVVAGSVATQDFCFLASAQNELVGGQRSSFFAWAAYLAQSPALIIRSYSVDPPSEELLSSSASSSSKQSMRLPYEWKDPVLATKWKFQVYASSTATSTGSKVV